MSADADDLVIKLEQDRTCFSNLEYTYQVPERHK